MRSISRRNQTRSLAFMRSIVAGAGPALEDDGLMRGHYDARQGLPELPAFDRAEMRNSIPTGRASDCCDQPENKARSYSSTPPFAASGVRARESWPGHGAVQLQLSAS